MYKLLLITDREDIQEMFRDRVNWPGLNCRAPLIASTAQEGIELLNSRAIDAVGYHLPKQEAVPLIQFLRYGRPSLPIFEVCDQKEKQRMVLAETAVLLDRLHADFADEYYDEAAMLTLQRDEMVHRLLAGELQDWEAAQRGLKLIRARISVDKPCLLYEIDMPQGDVYLAEHRGHAQQRLESALRNNFFGRYVDGVYYAVAVLTPRHIRLACIPMQGDIREDDASFSARADDHVHQSIQKIKEYLDLDMNIVRSKWLEGVKDLLSQQQE